MQQPRTTQELARQMQGVTRTSRGFQSLLPDIRALRSQLGARGDRAGLADLAEKIRLWAPGERAPAVTARVLAEAADVLGDAEQWERAAQLIERALQANPLDESVIDRASATMARGGAFEELHDVLTSHAHLLDRRVPEDSVARSSAWLRVGRIRAERLRNIDAAIAAYDTAIQIEPDVTALRELSALLEARGRPDDRESAADLYCLLGELLGGDQGAVYYARALNLNPQHPEALAQLGAPGPSAAQAYAPPPQPQRPSSPPPLRASGAPPAARASAPAPQAVRVTQPGPAVAPRISQQAPQPSAHGMQPGVGPYGSQGASPYGAPMANPFAMPQPGASPQHPFGVPAGSIPQRAAAPTPDSRFAATVLQQPQGFVEPVIQAATPVALAPSFAPQDAPGACDVQPDVTWTGDLRLQLDKKRKPWGAYVALVLVLGTGAVSYVKRDQVRELVAQVMPGAPSARPMEQVQGAAQATAPTSEPAPAMPAATGTSAAAPSATGASTAPAAPAPTVTPVAPSAAEPEKPAAEPEKQVSGGAVAMVKNSLKLSGGRLSRSAVVESLEEALAQMDDCYDRALGKKPRLSGKLSLAFVVRPSGRVDRVQKSSDTLKDSATAACIVRAVEHARFPKPKGSAARVKLGLSFSKS